MLGTVNFTIWVLYIFVLLWIFLSFLVLIILHYSSKTYLSPQCPVSHEVFYSGWWEQALFLALQEHYALFVQCSFQMVLFSVGYFPHMNALLTFLLNTWGATLADLWRSNSLCSSLLSCDSVLGAPAAMEPPDAHLCLLSLEVCQLPWFTFGKQSWLHGPRQVVQGPKLQKAMFEAPLVATILNLYNNFTFCVL